MAQHYVLVLLALSLCSGILYPVSAFTDPSNVIACATDGWNTSLGGDPCDKSWKAISCNASSVLFRLGGNQFHIGANYPPWNFPSDQNHSSKRKEATLACMIVRVALVAAYALFMALQPHILPPHRKPHIPSTPYIPRFGKRVYPKNQYHSYIPRQQYIPRKVIGLRGIHGAYYTLVLQWPSTTRIYNNQSTVGLDQIVGPEPIFTIHGLYTDNFNHTSGGGFDDTLGGDTLLRDTAERDWPNVLTPANIPLLDHHKWLWAHEWTTHGVHCPLSQRDYMWFTLQMFDVIARNHLMRFFNESCTNPIDDFGTRILEVNKFLTKFISGPVPPPAITIERRSHPTGLDTIKELKWVICGNQQFGQPILFGCSLHLSKCHSSYLEVPCNSEV